MRGVPGQFRSSRRPRSRVPQRPGRSLTPQGSGSGQVEAPGPGAFALAASAVAEHANEFRGRCALRHSGNAHRSSGPYSRASMSCGSAARSEVILPTMKIIAGYDFAITDMVSPVLNELQTNIRSTISHIFWQIGQLFPRSLKERAR